MSAQTQVNGAPIAEKRQCFPMRGMPKKPAMISPDMRCLAVCIFLQKSAQSSSLTMLLREGGSSSRQDPQIVAAPSPVALRVS